MADPAKTGNFNFISGIESNHRWLRNHVRLVVKQNQSKSVNKPKEVGLMKPQNKPSNKHTVYMYTVD